MDADKIMKLLMEEPSDDSEDARSLENEHLPGSTKS